VTYRPLTSNDPIFILIGLAEIFRGAGVPGGSGDKYLEDSECLETRKIRVYGGEEVREAYF